jgi:hypothetical protein
VLIGRVVFVLVVSQDTSPSTPLKMLATQQQRPLANCGTKGQTASLRPRQRLNMRPRAALKATVAEVAESEPSGRLSKRAALSLSLGAASLLMGAGLPQR